MERKFFLLRWLDGLFKAIGKIFNGLNKEIRENIDYAIDIVNRVKGGLDETVIDDLIVYLIPGDKDDKIVADLRQWLPIILASLTKIKETPDADGVNATLLAALNEIKISEDHPRGMYLRSLAALLVERLSDGKLDVDDAAIIAAYIYKNRKKANA